MYGLFGAYDFVFHSHRDLREQVRSSRTARRLTCRGTPRASSYSTSIPTPAGEDVGEGQARAISQLARLVAQRRIRRLDGGAVGPGKGPGSNPTGDENEFKESPEAQRAREGARGVAQARAKRAARGFSEASASRARRMASSTSSSSTAPCTSVSCRGGRTGPFAYARRATSDWRPSARYPCRRTASRGSNPRASWTCRCATAPPCFARPAGTRVLPKRRGRARCRRRRAPRAEEALRNVAEWLDDRPARDGEVRFGWETWEDPFFDDADSRLDVL